MEATLQGLKAEQARATAKEAGAVAAAATAEKGAAELHKITLVKANSTSSKRLEDSDNSKSTPELTSLQSLLLGVKRSYLIANIQNKFPPSSLKQLAQGELKTTD